LARTILLPRLYDFLETLGTTWESVLVFNGKIVANVFSADFATKRAIDQGVCVVSPVPISFEEGMVRSVPTSLIDFNAVHRFSPSGNKIGIKRRAIAEVIQQRTNAGKLSLLLGEKLGRRITWVL
jgi:hypothetical protein